MTVSTLYQSQMIITWFYEDFVTGENREEHDVLSIGNLHQGLVGVIVRSVSCNNIVFESFKYVENDSNEFNATITVTTNTQSCEVVSAELVVVPTGGMGPYTFEWETNFMTVYEPGYYSCKVWDSYNNECLAETIVSMEKLKCAVDPNEIFGPDGFGDEKMIAATQSISYTITFENDPEFATAPASRVEIEYPIPAEQRLASFRLGDFGFGQFVFTVPNNTSSYYQRLDVSDSLGVWVDVTAGIDVIHNKAFWIFQSIDPATGSEPQNSQLGFLLVNDDEGRGEGYVNYYISPADGLQTGDTTSAVATIVFDDNAPIATNVWTNMFDAAAPTSTIASTNIIETDSTNCIISFSSQDDMNGSGVHSIELFVSVNGAQYVSAGSYAYEAEVSYPLMNGLYYEFISIATDNVGNVEDFKTIPDATVDYGLAPSDITLSKYYFYENELVGSVVGELNTIDIGDVFTYQLVDGEGASDNSLFAISENKLVTNADFNCEERLDYSVRVRSTDVSNLYVEKTFDISMVKTNQTYDLDYEGDICQGENFFGYGWNINLLDSVPGTYTYTRHLQTTSGCDSIRTLTVRVHPEYLIPITDEIAYGEDYTLNGFNIVNPTIGIVYDTLYLHTTQGCDSIVSLTLTINPGVVNYIQTTNLTTGWNWWSCYVELDGIDGLNMLQEGLGTSGVTIKSQNDGYNSYLDGYGWYGSLGTLNNESSYQIRTATICEVQMTGSAISPDNHPITINPGWSWIGYPVSISLSLGEAFSGITPMTNDMLKSQNDGFASYLEGFGWYGALNTLNPGMGLMYKSFSNTSITFSYPTGGAKGNLKANQTTENNHWRPNLNAYADNMSVMAVVELDGNELQGENFELAAFANGEVRGSARLLYVEPLNRYMAFLTVAGDEATELRFALYNTETGDVETQSFASLQYETDAVVGSFAEPYVVSFRSITGLEEWANSVSLFPNPVERGETVTLGLPEVETLRATSVETIDALGMVVETHGHASLQRITAPKVAGVYTLRITVEGKGTCYRKLVVR